MSPNLSTKDAITLLEEIKEQLDRLESNITTDRENTERAIDEIKNEIKNQYSAPVKAQPADSDLENLLGNLPALGNLKDNLPDLGPLLENPQKLLDSPLMKLLPLFTSDKFSQTLDVIQKIQKGQLPAPSELLPVAKTFFAKPGGQMTLLAENNPKFQKLRTMQSELYNSRSELEKTMQKIQSMNTEAMALLEIAELLFMRKQQVP